MKINKFLYFTRILGINDKVFVRPRLQQQEANNSSRLISLRNLRKALTAFLYQSHREGI